MYWMSPELLELLVCGCVVWVVVGYLAMLCEQVLTTADMYQPLGADVDVSSLLRWLAGRYECVQWSGSGCAEGVIVWLGNELV